MNKIGQQLSNFELKNYKKTWKANKKFKNQKTFS